MDNRANPRISIKPVQQIIDPNDFSNSLRPAQQIVDPNDFTLFGSVEVCSLDHNVPKLRDKVQGNKLFLSAKVDRNTTKSVLSTTVEGVSAKPLEVISLCEGLEESVPHVSVDTNHNPKKHISDATNTPNKLPKNVASFSESLPTLGGKVAVPGKKSTLQPTNSIPAESSSLKALLVCDRLIPTPVTSRDEQTNQATCAKPALDTPIQTTNPLDNVVKSPRAVIKFNSCTLHPPKIGYSHPVTQGKPPGCKTVWVGGLPDGATEEMLREIFERCGKIVDVRMVDMFYHVKFEQASAVDSAVALSGYRLFVGDSRDHSHSGLVFVDYVESKEDQLRTSQVQDHPTATEKTGQSTSSPAVSCTESDIAKAVEMVKRDDRFLEAVQLLSKWLEMDDYDEKNSEKIYSMIQETNAHAVRLQTEKKRQYEEMKRFRNQCRGKAEVISLQISHIERLFDITSQKKVLDHFTDAQKKDLILWKTEFLNYQEQIENLSTEVDDLSLLGADEEQGMKKSKLKEKETLRAEIEIAALKTEHETELATKNGEIQKLKTSLESVRKDLENSEDLRMKKEKKSAYLSNKKVSQDPARCNILEKKLKDCTNDLKHERQFVITLKTEISELKKWLADGDYNNKQLMKQMSDNEREYQHTLSVLNKRLYDREVELEEAGRRIWKVEMNQPEAPATDTVHNKLLNQRTELARLVRLRAEDKAKIETLEKELRTKPPADTVNVRDAKTISTISSFLLIHPGGVGINFITQYVQRMDPTASPIYVQSVLCKYSAIFVFDLVENKWMLDVHAKSEPKSDSTDRAWSRDSSCDNSVGNSSPTKKTRSRTRPPRIKRPIGTDPHSSGLASEKGGQTIGTNHISGLDSQLQPPTSQIGQSIGTTFQSSGVNSEISPLLSFSRPQSSHIQPQSSQIQPQSFQIQPESSQIRPQSSQIQPQSFQIRPQSSQIQPQSFQIQPQSFQIQPESSQIRPQSSQTPQSPQIGEQGGSGDVELRSNGLSTFAEEIRLTKLLKKYPDSSQWSPQLLRRLQEICVFRNKNSIYLKSSQRSIVRVVVPMVTDEEREIYKHTVTIPDAYPEEIWQRRCGNSEEFSSDSISETSISGYYPFSNQKKDDQYSASPISPTSNEIPQNVRNIDEEMTDSVFKTPKDLLRSTQNQKLWRSEANAQNSSKKRTVKRVAEEHRLARIVAYLPNHSNWSLALHARLRSFIPVKSPQSKRRFFLRKSDGRQVEVFLPKIKLGKLAKLNAAVIPDKYPEEYILDRKEKKAIEKGVLSWSRDDCAIAGSSYLPAGKPTLVMNLSEIKPERSKAHLGTLNASRSFESITSPGETTDEPVELTSTPLKSPGENSHQSKKYEEMTTDNQASSEFRTLQPQIPYRRPPVLIIQQDQQNQAVKKRHCLEDSQEPPAKVKKNTPEDSESCSGKDVQHSEAKTHLINDSTDDKVSEVRKSSKKPQTVSKPEDRLAADDEAKVSVKGDAKKIDREKNTEKGVETTLSGYGKSDGVAANVGKCSQKVAKLDESSVQPQSSKKTKSADTEPEEKGLKENAINAGEEILRVSKKSGTSSKEFRINRQKTTDSKRTSGIKDEPKRREHKNSSAENSHRKKETVVGNVDKLGGDGITKKHGCSKDIKMCRWKLRKNKDESPSVDSGGNNKDATKKELDEAKISSEFCKSLAKHVERSKKITSGTEAKPSVVAESSSRGNCDGPRPGENDPETTVEKPVRPTKELSERLQKLFNSSNESVLVDSQENCSNQESTKAENVPKDLGEKSNNDPQVSSNKIITFDARDLEKTNEGEEFVKDTIKGSDVDQAVKNSGTSSGFSKPSHNISKKEYENVTNDSKDSQISNKKIISVDARDTSGALEKAHKREELVKDTKGSIVEQAIENAGTSSSSSKRSQNIPNNEYENVPKDFGEKNSKKIISVGSGSLEKSDRMKEGVTEPTKSSAEEHISQSVKNFSGTSSGSSKRPRKISRGEDAEQISGKNFDQKCKDFRKKYLESAKRKPNKALGEKGLDNKVPNKKQNENPISSMTFAEYLSSQPKIKLVKKTENTKDGEKQMPTESRSGSEKTRKRCSVREDLFPKEPEASSSKKSATEGDWEDVMQTLDSVPQKRSKPIKLTLISRPEENVGQNPLEISVKSSKSLELSQNSQIKKKLCRSPSKPNMYPKIRVKNLETMIRPSGWQNSAKSKKKTSVGNHRKPADAREESSKKTTSATQVSVGKTVHQQSKDVSTKSASNLDQGDDPPTPISRLEKAVKEEQLESITDDPRLEKYECPLKQDSVETDELEHTYEASSISAQDLRNELHQLFGKGEPEEVEEAPGTSEQGEDFYCDTFLSSEDILRLAGEGPDM